MAVIKRGDRWHVRFRYLCPTTGSRRRFQRSTGRGTTKREAELLEAEWRLEATRPPEPTKAPTKRAQFSGFARHWLDTWAAVNRKPTTHRSYEQHCRLYLVPFFQDAWLRTIDGERVEAFKAWMLNDRELSRKTVNNALATLSSLFNRAVAWGYCEKSPVESVTMLKLPPSTFRFWDASQAARFLESCARVRPGWHAFFATALQTGMRLGELIALEWGDLDLARAQVHVQRSKSDGGQTTTPKSGHGRVIPLPSTLVAVLGEHPRHLGSDLVFPAPTGKHRSPGVPAKPLNYVQKVAGLPPLSVHDLRHSYASQLVMAGVPLKAVQEYLGHADIKTTMRYAHLSPAAKRSYVELLVKTC